MKAHRGSAGWLGCCVLVALALLGISHQVRAAGPYDPDIRWRTVSSRNFKVHYPDDAYNLAVRVSRIGEEVLDDVAEVFGYKPEDRIQIVLSDAIDAANGSAQVLPQNIKWTVNMTCVKNSRS